jgi:hypothetical protein
MYSIKTIRFGDMIPNINKRIPLEVIAEWQRSSVALRTSMDALFEILSNVQ